MTAHRPSPAHGHLPAPDQVRATFDRLLRANPEQAVEYLHGLGISSGYIRNEAVAGTVRWTSESPYGTVECSINTAKPEKDPLAIAQAAVATPQNVGHAVPLCDLCWENEGFAGTPEHPAKPGLRIASIKLGGEQWGLQYSPFAYFSEHCIALCRQHRPMGIDRSCFERLFDFVDLFPFYFIGSNADLPIVGGSILSHDHFQGGRHTFPLMNAPIEHDIALLSTPQVRCGIVRWPASVLRLVSCDRDALVQVATHVLDVWRTFADEGCNIVPSSADIPHSTLNPIVRKTDATYCMDLVLRNNRTDDQHPQGIFHPPASLHHLKKENIGLIEIMGLAILPPRLATELALVQHELTDAARKDATPADLEIRLLQCDQTAAHALWAKGVLERRRTELLGKSASRGAGSTGEAHPHPTAPRQDGAPLQHATDLHPVLQQEVSSAFVRILETTGVFKRDDRGKAGWKAFIESLDWA